MEEPKENLTKESTEENVSKFLCDICNFEAPNQSFLEMHFTKKQHKDKMVLLRRPFYCRVCHVESYDKDEFDRHLDGKKHKKLSRYLDGKKRKKMSEKQKVA